MKRFLKLILITFIGIPFCICMRLISPFFKIRVGSFYGERIGHFANDVGQYLSEKDFYNIDSLDFFFIGGNVSNRFFLKLVKRKIYINKFFMILYEANRILPNYHKYEVLVGSSKSSGLTADLRGLENKTGVNLDFNEQEHVQASKFLKEVGCNSKFICLNVRDSEYLKRTFPEVDFTDHEYRDSDIETYKKTIHYLLDKNYYVFRMGKIVQKTLNIEHPNFLDYSASKYRCDFLDVWLMANCYFCISTATGLDEIARVFRKPINYVNAMPIGHFPSSYPGCIWTPKTIITKDNIRKLSLDDIIHHSAIDFPESRSYQSNLDLKNLRLINNTEDEILGSTIEMDKKLNNTWNFTKEHEENQRLFWEKLETWSNFNSYHNNNQEDRVGIISDYYLKKNTDWFLK